jgi:hypothetical protein
LHRGVSGMVVGRVDQDKSQGGVVVVVVVVANTHVDPEMDSVDGGVVPAVGRG